VVCDTGHNINDEEDHMTDLLDVLHKEIGTLHPGRDHARINEIIIAINKELERVYRELSPMEATRDRLISLGEYAQDVGRGVNLVYPVDSILAAEKREAARG
jgi:hypothetical protein